MYITAILRSPGFRTKILSHAPTASSQPVASQFIRDCWRCCATRAAVGSSSGGEKATRQLDLSTKDGAGVSSRPAPTPVSEPLLKPEKILPETKTSTSTNASVAEPSQSSGATPKTANESTVKIPSDGKIPDVPSSSLGLWEEQDEKDPNKWKKFAWKYAGAVVVFLISYKTLHWYVDRMEAEGKRQRDELEEKKKISEELHASQKRLPIFDGPSPSGIRPSERLHTPPTLPPSPILSTMSESPTPSDEYVADPQTPQLPKELLDQFAAPLPQTSSELDELYAYRKELEVQLATHVGGSASKGEQGSDQIAEMREELASLAEEIQQLEKKRLLR